jgi:DNA-binding NarL/FixJ family response regulator
MTLGASAAVAKSATPPAQVCRLVLIDGQQIFRHALRVLLDTEDGFTVVGEAGQRSEALELIANLQPDVVITDLHLTDGSGVQLIEDIRAHFPKVAILVLTAVRARDSAAAARKAGALGYLLKECGRSELRSALDAIVTGRRYRSRSPTITTRRRADLSAFGNRAAYLTERQRLILGSLARGQPTRQIAQTLGVSVRAVQKQRERLRITLQLDGTAALTRFALREGFAE